MRPPARARGWPAILEVVRLGESAQVRLDRDPLAYRVWPGGADPDGRRGVAEGRRLGGTAALSQRHEERRRKHVAGADVIDELLDARHLELQDLATGNVQRGRIRGRRDRHEGSERARGARGLTA